MREKILRNEEFFCAKLKRLLIVERVKGTGKIAWLEQLAVAWCQTLGRFLNDEWLVFTLLLLLLVMIHYHKQGIVVVRS